MFNQFSYKKKVLYTAILAALLTFASFKKNVKKILQINKQLQELQIGQLEDRVFDDDIAYLQQEIKTIEAYIGGVNISPDYVQQQLIKFISNTPLTVEITSIEGIHQASIDQFNILTNQVTITGDYKI